MVNVKELSDLELIEMKSTTDEEEKEQISKELEDRKRAVEKACCK